MPTTNTLRHRVLLQRRATGADAAGQALQSWQDVATVWAAVEPIRGAEWFAAGQEQASADVRVTIRHRTDVTSAWRVVPSVGSPYAGQPMDVQGMPIDVRGERRYLELMCLAGVKDGR